MVCIARIVQVVHADADQPESGAVSLPLQQFAGCFEDACCELGGLGQGARACAEFEVRSLQFQSNCCAADICLFEARRDLFAEQEKAARQNFPIGDVAFESCFGGNAFRLPIRFHLAIVDAVREAPETTTFRAVAAEQVVLLGALKVGNGDITVLP